MIELSTPAATRLERVPHDLQSEFPDVPIELLVRDVEHHTMKLLETAHFDDFIPLLVRRHVREQLQGAE